MKPVFLTIEEIDFLCYLLSEKSSFYYQQKYTVGLYGEHLERARLAVFLLIKLTLKSIEDEKEDID